MKICGSRDSFVDTESLQSHQATFKILRTNTGQLFISLKPLKFYLHNANWSLVIRVLIYFLHAKQKFSMVNPHHIYCSSFHYKLHSCVAHVRFARKKLPIKELRLQIFTVFSFCNIKSVLVFNSDFKNILNIVTF